MKTAGIIGMLLMFAACGSDFAKDGAKIADEMCACKDAECADKVTAKWKTLGEKAQKEFEKESDVPKDLMEKMEKIEERYRGCRDKARGAGGEEAK